MGRMKSFFMGQASGVVEPIAGVLGAAFVVQMQESCLIPFVLLPGQ